MPQIVALALIGAGLLAGYRVLSRIAAEAAANLKRAEKEMSRRTGVDEPRDLGALEWDEKGGVYRPQGPRG